MVSQPDPYPASLAVRGTQSVVSSRSSRPHVSSRSKRYNRSHAGGTSYVPQNEFPVFGHSGDVEIIISAGGVENRYLLHRDTLVRCSGFFEASTSREWSKASVLPLLEPASKDLARIGVGDGGGGIANSGGSEVARPGEDSLVPRRRWRYVLDPGIDGDDIPMLVQREANSGGGDGNNNARAPAQAKSLFGGGISSAPSVRNKPAPSHANSASSFFRSVANLSLTHAPRRHHEPIPDIGANPQLSQADEDLLRDYDNMFRIFYNYPPVLDGVSIADAYVQCKSLLTLADLYDALAVCGPRVDHHLLQFRGRLWKQVAKYPVSYLRLGYLARSKVIFQEALIHVVGQWPAGERSIRQGLPEAVVDIIEDKVDELEETVARVEGRLFRLALTNSRGERVGPNTSYLDWLAVSLFRQWLADNTSPAQPPRPPPPPLPPPSSSSDHDRRGPHHRHHGHGHHSTSSRGGGGSAVEGGSRNAVQAPAPASLASVGRTYRLLGSPSGAAYLGHDDCKRFLKLTPDLYSRDNLRRFEKRVDELKAAAREVVRPLMGSGLELEHEIAAAGRNRGDAVEVAAGVTSYLTCVRVYDRDLPWGVDEG